MNSLLDADSEVVKYLSAAIRLRDDETGRHIERVSLSAEALADWAGLSFSPARGIRLAAAMHDVGKIGIPDRVLLKPGRLTDEETEIVRTHCELGHDLLSGTSNPILTLAASVALNHHERWDGKGYPNRRIGKDIPIEARITAVADVFDALASNRVYRDAFPVETVVDIMQRERGGLFDPMLLDLFIKNLDAVLAMAATLPDPPRARITRIVIVDQEGIFAAGLTRMLHGNAGLRVVGSAGSMQDATRVMDELRPDVMVSGYLLPDGDGSVLSGIVLGRNPETKVLILTSVATPEVALRCISAGCAGLVSKSTSADEVASAVRRVHDGEVVIPSDLLPYLASQLHRPALVKGADLTPREHELLRHLTRGRSLAQIADTMSISLNTARNHTQRVLEKLGAHSKLEAVVIALREHLVEPEPSGTSDSSALVTIGRRRPLVVLENV